MGESRAGLTWLEADTPDMLVRASRNVYTLENRLGVRVAGMVEMHCAWA